MENVAAPLVTLRRLGAMAPWSLDELARLADQLLDGRLGPDARPTTGRMVRFYVSRDVIRPPFGRGAGSTWGYPHLVELLAARVAQHDGLGLDAIAARRGRVALVELEEQVAEHFGAPLPAADAAALVEQPVAVESRGWWRVDLADGVELHLREGHPLLADSRRLSALIDDLRTEIATPPEES